MKPVYCEPPNPTDATGAFHRALGWLCLPLLLLVAVCTVHQAELLDQHATLSSFVVDISAFNHNPSDSHYNPDHDVIAPPAWLSAAIERQAAPALPTRAAPRAARRSFSPRAPPIS